MAILRDNWIVIAIAVAALAALALLIWLWWWVPKWQMRSVTTGDPKARADIEDNFRKTVGQALGGAAVLISAGAAYFQFTQQQQASHDLLISNQASKGFEQLAGKEMSMRLGGIYALEGVMNTSEQYHQPVLEALCAFVRDSTRDLKGNNPPATDVQAALTVIGRRQSGPGRVDLAGANIPGATLTNAKNLSDADLTHVDLSGANLFYAHLSHANLSGANLSDARLSYAHLDFANLSSAYLSDANLSRVVLTGANLGSVHLRSANLGGANLIATNLSGADLAFAKLIDSDLEDANLTRADLSRIDLTGAKHLTQAQLDQACGDGTKLPPGLTLEPCREKPVAPALNRRTTP